MENFARISDLLGCTIVNVEQPLGGDCLYFTLDNGTRFRMRHAQECCEDVYIHDIAGDFADICNAPILMAEESVSSEHPPADMDDECFRWTFYKFATIKGYVTIRWAGASNGYYGVSVDFEHVS